MTAPGVMSAFFSLTRQKARARIYLTPQAPSPTLWRGGVFVPPLRRSGFQPRVLGFAAGSRSYGVFEARFLRNAPPCIILKIPPHVILNRPLLSS